MAGRGEGTGAQSGVRGWKCGWWKQMCVMETVTAFTLCKKLAAARASRRGGGGDTKQQAASDWSGGAIHITAMWLVKGGGLAEIFSGAAPVFFFFFFKQQEVKAPLLRRRCSCTAAEGCGWRGSGVFRIFLPEWLRAKTVVTGLLWGGYNQL